MTTTPISKFSDEPSCCFDQNNERERYGLMIVMKEDELEVEQKSEGKYEVTVEVLMAEV